MNKWIMTVLSVVILFSACAESDGSDFIFKYDISDNPRTLDPQTATDENSRLVIANMFQGLLKLDERGNVTSGVAGEYFVSDDGLTYTFELKEDIYWYRGQEGEPVRCTAHDFVFGFRRLINPATKSQNAERFFVIKNAKDINNGKIDDITRLGVEALSDYRLVIRLEYPDLQFPSLLTTTPAMPCNEEFYKRTQGRYGLNVDSVISNGSFYLYRWNYDRYSSVNNHLILRRNKLNNEVNRIYPYGLNFFIDETDSKLNFLVGDSHSLVSSGEEAAELIDNYPFDEYENFVWGIVFNTKGESAYEKERIFSDKDFRYALSASFSRDDIFTDRVGFKKTGLFIPHTVKLGEDDYRSLGSELFATAVLEDSDLASAYSLEPKFDIQGAKLAFNRALEHREVSNINGLDLLVPDNPVICEYLGFILQKWQKELGFYCNIKVLPQLQFDIEVAAGNYDFAAVRISGDYNSPSAYLNYFGYNGSSPAFNKNSDYMRNIDLAEKSTDKTKSFEYYIKAEQELINSAVFIPLCFQTEYFFYQKKCKNILYNPFTGVIDYSKAKYFS